MKRILAIDGGGIKGVAPASFLAVVEEATGEKIVDHFDLIAGTSTGGLIALGLGIGLSAQEILTFYRERGPQVFGQLEGCLDRILRYVRWPLRPKYDPSNLRAELFEVFREKKLGHSFTRLVIPAYHRDRQSVYVFKTAHHPRLEVDCHVDAVDVAMATAAAPVYFPSHRIPTGSHLLDGGIWANNPTGLAVVEAVGILGWPGHDLRVLSLGCTDDTWTFVADPGLVGMGLMGRNLINLFLQGQSNASLGVANILTGHPHSGTRVWRYSPKVPAGTFSMDRTSQIERLAGLGAVEARGALPHLRKEFLTTARERFTPDHELPSDTC